MPPEEKAILAVVPEIADYVMALKQRGRKVPGLALRQLLRLVRGPRHRRPGPCTGIARPRDPEWHTPLRRRGGAWA